MTSLTTHTPRRDADISNNKTDKELSPMPPVTAPTSPNTPATALPLSASYNTRAAAHSEPDHKILTQLYLAATDKCEL
jgi:hypothetical protein